MPTPRTKSSNTKAESNITLTNSTKNPMYDSQTKSWCLESKKELIRTAKNNLNKRMTKFLSVTRSSNIKLKHFNISNTEISKMIKGCCNTILSWNGVEMESCKQQKTTYKQYRITAINWFNRNKAKIFANHLFFPIIFNYLLNFIQQVEMDNMNGADQNRMYLFVDTLLIIFDEDINFARTKSQPLIPYQSLIQPNSFKSQCKHFIEFYGIKWDQTGIIPAKINRIYQKDKKRSKKIYQTFIHSLNELKQLLTNKNVNPFKFYSLRKNNFKFKIKNDENVNISNNNNLNSISNISTTNSIGNFGRNVNSFQNVYNAQNNGQNAQNNGQNAQNIVNSFFGNNYNVMNPMPLQTQLTQLRSNSNNINNLSLSPNFTTNNTNMNTMSNINNIFGDQIHGTFNNNNNNNNNWSNQFNLNNSINSNQLNQLFLVPIGNINNFNHNNQNTGTVLQYQLVSVPSILIQQYQFAPNNNSNSHTPM